MAKKSKYSAENFMMELKALRKKYKKIDNEDLSTIIGFYFYEESLDWNNFIHAFCASVKVNSVVTNWVEEERPSKKQPKKGPKKSGRPKKTKVDEAK